MASSEESDSSREAAGFFVEQSIVVSAARHCGHAFQWVQVMSDDKAISAAKRSRARKRRFYEMGPDFNGGRPGFWVADESVLPPHGVYRLPASTPPVPYMFNKSKGSLPYDLERCFHWWLISDRTKAVFERIDPEAFVFVPCDVRVPQGRYQGADYWLCDVARVLDALDESASCLRIGVRDDVHYLDHGQKYYAHIPGYKLVFREASIGNAHIFRMAYKDATVICDQEFKDACKSAGLKRIQFCDRAKSRY
ncbi:imm11 family protein [Bradyrhizobium sp. CCBAU 65884]|uniref:imm11 family protein n=1 Tax=Bradyrhizobium sp. CCBAU 65884 TaxID=722477 RepID=UPI002304DB31|nr:DUF1629 domain-containing protein [Bradyrhizobium sp. CCBAU 65884]